ncbi:MAG: PEP-CTERM sorting domain-containing protein [Rubrivivax sp.]|nr:PEP-CTERM sorting domain-containing protein [Rubrivivax sp.]
MKKPLVRILGAAALAVASLSVQAGGVPGPSLTFTGWAYDNGNNVNATTHAYRGSAGGFSATLSGAPGFDGALETYCVDLLQTIGFGIAYSDYGVVSAGSYFTEAKAQTLGKLISYVFDGDLFGGTAAGYKDDLSTALQVAIWNTVYDTDLTLASGTFKDSSPYKNGNSGNFAGANGLLSASQVASQPISYGLYVLSSPSRQDQLFWQALPETTSTTQGLPSQGGSVPEPGSLGLAAAAMAGLAFVARRRRR